ncbi:MAG: TRAM domain-containing protein, partial [Clostridia bacterium]|nr:TRAM domain-containing protein [Clostridia bacterium]
ERIQKLPVYIAIRTTFMAGFPGETEEDFNRLCEFIQKYKLMHVGFFAYSKEQDTTAANFVDQVSDDTKTKRLLKLMRIQQKIANEINKSFVGKTIEVCYEGIDYERQLFFGRSQYQTPEADTLVFFKSKKPIDIGKFYKVKITKVKGYDLQGEVEDEI